MEAYYHALALTVSGQGSLTVYHSGKRSESYQKDRWPRSRATLARWGRLPHDAPRQAVAELGITLKKLQTPSSDPVAGIRKHAEREACELLVMGTHARGGLARLLHKEIATTAMRKLQRPALLFPPGCRRFIDLETGEVRLRKVMVAVDHDPPAAHALQSVARLISSARAGTGVCREVHVGSTPPLNDRPELPGWTWKSSLLQGETPKALVEAAHEWDADLLAMVSRGRDHLVDLVLGSTLDQVLADSPCPVLAVPT